MWRWAHLLVEEAGVHEARVDDARTLLPLHLLGIKDGPLASPYLARALWVCYEICLSYSILVTVIVTFALIPMAKKRAPKVCWS